MSIKDKDSNVFVSLGLVLVDIYAAIPPRNASSLWGRLLKVAIVLGLLFCLKDLIKGLLVLAAIGALAYFSPSRSSKDIDAPYGRDVFGHRLDQWGHRDDGP
ncbi:MULTISPECIES: hypothetical protein [Azotobacter]|uniref:hypothetical protein n=1 Tax=Azotobacter TaxID=352 RepID=UPI0000527B3C|nr:hypothetical protein [Azotobacter vinelandii]GLK61029.1 hypothetical protein GCM10017624_31920 [Azotobacter vinelandii]SFY34375.1 hypothetical protein SAMN04244547_05200 [Azotobacter vinelandii]